MQQLLAAKYALIGTPTAQLKGESERKKAAAYKAAEGGAPDGAFFFSEEDLKSVGSIRADATGKNLLALLRHVGRLKEFKCAGMRCWQVR